MISKLGSLEEKIKLPATETISRFYQQPQSNRKAIRILTVAVYVFCVSLAAIMLSLYYVFIWDPSIRPFVTKVANCDKIVIPEQIAIQLLNSSEISAEQFYHNLYEYYQQHRIQYLRNKDLTFLNLQSATAVIKAQKQIDAAETETPNSLSKHHIIKQNELNEAALLESISASSRESHSATAPPINEKPSNNDDEDYSEDDSTMGLESSGFFPLNFEYNSRRKFDAD